MTTVEIFDVKLDKLVTVEVINRTDSEWKKILSHEVYEITTRKGTERPFTCAFKEVHDTGVFKCIRCGTDLFRVTTKFDSGTGWPSFSEPVSPKNIRQQPDNSLGMKRTEVLCARCGSHLGHVFDDGPPPTRKRYCMNGIALKFEPDGH